MSLGDILEGAVKGFVTTGGSTFGAFMGGIEGKEQGEAKRFREQQAAQAQETNRSGNMASNDFGFGYADPYASQLKVNGGSMGSSDGGFFGTLRSGIREVGGLVRDVIDTGIPSFFGGGNNVALNQGRNAIPTTRNVGAQESSGSGTIDAGAGALVPNLINFGRSVLKSPLGQVAIGTGAGAAVSMLGSDGKRMRITRKMKSQARMILNMTGGNIQAASDILGISPDLLIGILLKRFRNDGPVVTKAALRKTKQTVRRMKSMCDMYDSLRPTATRRRAPMKRASTTLISNK